MRPTRGASFVRKLPDFAPVTVLGLPADPLPARPDCPLPPPLPADLPAALFMLVLQVDVAQSRQGEVSRRTFQVSVAWFGQSSSRCGTDGFTKFLGFDHPQQLALPFGVSSRSDDSLALGERCAAVVTRTLRLLSPDVSVSTRRRWGRKESGGHMDGRSIKQSGRIRQRR